MQEKIVEILNKICGTDETKNHPDLNLFESGLMDSLGFIEFLVAVEKEFGINISPTEVAREDIDTVNKIVLFIRKKLDSE